MAIFLAFVYLHHGHLLADPWSISAELRVDLLESSGSWIPVLAITAFRDAGVAHQSLEPIHQNYS